jgi:hypothetical protein
MEVGYGVVIPFEEFLKQIATNEYGNLIFQD